jgi:Mrp family chromosome partitioning ATPase
MSRIFKALERAEAESKQASAAREARRAEAEGKQVSVEPEAPRAEAEGKQASVEPEARRAEAGTKQAFADPEALRPEAEAKRVSAAQISVAHEARPLSVIESPPDLELPEARDEYSQLKVMLALAANGSDQRSVMFVSALPREGVSTVTLGFACAAVEGASQGVLVIDANFVKPTLAARLGVSAKAGLSELLAKEISRADAIVATPVQGLFLLGPGRRPPDLSQPRVRGLLDEIFPELRASFDYVVVDGGALRRSLDSLHFGSRVDAVTLVIEAERTGMETARDAILQLRKAHANVVGTLLNRRREYLPKFLARRL